MRKSASFIAAIVALILSGCDAGKKPDSQNQSQPFATAKIPDRGVGNPFPSAKEVRLFVEVKYSKSGNPVLSAPAGRVLSASQRTVFEQALYFTTPPPETAACFIPHHFFRYFDKNGKQIGEVAVCFCCAGVEASGQGNLIADDGQILSANFDDVEKLVKALGEPTDVLCD